MLLTSKEKDHFLHGRRLQAVEVIFGIASVIIFAGSSIC
jgi:hypothetical protein